MVVSYKGILLRFKGERPMIEGLENLISNERSTGYKGLLMNKLVKIWSGESFYIEDVGMEASVDLRSKKMHLPLNSMDWQTLRALGQHESAHVLFTNTNSYIKLTKGLSDKYGIEKVWKVVNTFEDRRIEYLFSKIYAGARSEFRDNNTESIKTLLEKGLDYYKPLDRILIQVSAYLVSGIKPKNEELQSLAVEIKEEIESEWTQTSVINTTEKVLDYLDKYLAKRKKEREDAKAKKRIRTSGEKKDEESSEGTSDEGDKSEGDSESDESFDIDKFLEDNEETEESKEDTEKTKDKCKPEKREGEHKDGDLSGKSKESEKEDDDKDGDDGEEDYDDEEDLKTEEDITGEKEKIEESSFKSKIKNKKSIEKLIKSKKSVVIDNSDEKKITDPFRKLSKESYIPVRRLITEEEIERDFTEHHKRYYEYIKNKNIGLIRRLRTNLLEIKNAVEIQESKGGLININRSINTVAQSGRPAFIRAVENTKRNVSLTFLLDQSGSMHGSEMDEAKKALIILSEVLNGLQGFEFAMFGFYSVNSSTYGKDYHTMKTFQYKGFSTKKTDLIVSADIGNGNRDGYHIRVVRDYIQQHADVNAAKFLVVLSDGIPQDDGTEYMWQIALNDTMKAVQEVESQFPVIGVLFGNPTPGQQHLYKNRVHCAFGRLSEGLEELVLNVQQQIMRG